MIKSRLISLLTITLICITSYAQRYKDYETIAVNDTCRQIVYVGQLLKSKNVSDTISKLDNSKAMKEGKDSVYTIKYAYKIKNGSADSIKTYLQRFKEVVLKESSYKDIDDRTYAIIDSLDSGTDGVAFLYAPSIRRNSFARIPSFGGCDGYSKTGEYAEIDLKLNQRNDSVILLMAVHGIDVSYAGGITGSGMSSYITAKELFLNETERSREQSSSLLNHLREYVNKTAIDVLRYLNGENWKPFRKCGKIKVQNGSILERKM